MDRRSGVWTGGAGGRVGLGIVTALALLLAPAPPAQAGGSVGVRFGWADVSDEVFKGSGDLGGTNLIGLHLNIGLLPLLDVEVAGEYTSEEFSFTEGVVEGFEAAGDGEWEDMALYATGRAKVLGFAFLPIHGYVGGGLNVHWAELTLENYEHVGGDPPGGNEFEEAVEDVAGDRSEAGWHLVAGVRLAPPASPLSAFLEARYMKGFDADRLPESKAIYLGASIGL